MSKATKTKLSGGKYSNSHLTTIEREGEEGRIAEFKGPCDSVTGSHQTTVVNIVPNVYGFLRQFNKG